MDMDMEDLGARGASYLPLLPSTLRVLDVQLYPSPRVTRATCPPTAKLDSDALVL